MKIKQINNIWSKCQLQDIPELKTLLYYDAVYWKRTSWGRKKEVYKKYLVNKAGYFYTGFFPLIQKEFSNCIIERKQEKQMTAKKVEKLTSLSLRDYQKTLLQASIKGKRGVLKSPTGSGKTLVEAAIISSFCDSISLLIVHTKSLLSQIHKELETLCEEEVGIVGNGKEDWKGITIGMIQTLSKMDKDYLLKKDIDLVIVDECHHVCATTYEHVLSAINAPYRFGFSATPKDFEDERGEYLKVIGLLGSIIHCVDYEDVKEVLAIPKVEMLNFKDYNLDRMCWNQAYRKGIEENIIRNRTIEMYVEENNGKSILILVKTIKHGKELEMFISNSVLICGFDDIDSRERAKKMLVKKGIVIATSVFGEGVDIPSLDILINAGAGCSRIQTIQRAGRVLRKTENKTEGIIVDFWDCGNKYLERHSRQRYETYRKLGWIERS